MASIDETKARLLRGVVQDNINVLQNVRVTGSKRLKSHRSLWPWAGLAAAAPAFNMPGVVPAELCACGPPNPPGGGIIGGPPIGAMCGDVLDAPRELAMRERYAEAAAGALRGADAGHDLDRNTSFVASRYLLAGAAEDHRIAGFHLRYA